jgi:hypothetical protein
LAHQVLHVDGHGSVAHVLLLLVTLRPFIPLVLVLLDVGQEDAEGFSSFLPSLAVLEGELGTAAEGGGAALFEEVRVLVDCEAVVGGHVGVEGVSLQLLDVDARGHEGLPLPQVHLLLRVSLLLPLLLALLALLRLLLHVLLEQVVQPARLRLLSCVVVAADCPPEGLGLALFEVLLMGKFVFQFAGAAVGLFVADVEQFLIVVELLAVPVEFFVDFQLEDPAVEVGGERAHEVEAEREEVGDGEVALLALWAAEGDLVGVAVVDASPPECDAGGAFLGARSGEVAGVVVEVAHPAGEQVGQFLGEVGRAGAHAAVHEARLLLRVAVDVHKQQFLVFALQDDLLYVVDLRVQGLAGILPLSVEVKPRQRTAIAAVDHAIRVQHWHYLYYELIA